MPEKGAVPNLFAIKDLAIREALRVQADVTNAARAEARRVKASGEETTRNINDLTTRVSQLGGLKPALQALTSNVNIALDHPWFILEISADQSIANDTEGVAVLWDKVVAGNTSGLYSPAGASGLIDLFKKPGLWAVWATAEWAANATGSRVIDIAGGGWTANDMRTPPAVGGTRHSASGFFPSHVAYGGGTWAPLRVFAYQNSGGLLDLEGGVGRTTLTCYYLGLFGV